MHRNFVVLHRTGGDATLEKIMHPLNFSSILAMGEAAAPQEPVRNFVFEA